jgi:hypothetical protein
VRESTHTRLEEGLRSRLFSEPAPPRAAAIIGSLWISKTGMEGQQTQLDHISHNLANVSAVGAEAVVEFAG